MCMSFVPPGRTKKIRIRQRDGPKTRSRTKVGKKYIGKKKSYDYKQLTLADCFGHDLESMNTKLSEALGASGDELRPKHDDCIRFAFQNVHGIHIENEFNVMPETATIGALQIDIAALTETNLHWNKKNKELIEAQMQRHLGLSRVICASNVSTKVEEGYQPGGSMLAVVGNQVGRLMKSGSDPWGRYTWTEMRGERDEGIIVISAYRVSQKKGTVAGPSTAYSQQIDKMILEGDTNLDPRTRILTDLRDLITKKRQEGLRPILMMDANDEWASTGSKSFQQFVSDLNLVDPLYNKFGKDGITKSTYSRGSRRIDFILMDPTLEHAVERVGTLALHEGMDSDHVMLYMDVNEKKLFRGVINRPVLNPSREFVVEQADKAEKFLKKFKEIVEERKFDVRTKKLAENFAKYGASDKNVATYQTLDDEIIECIRVAAKSVVKKKFGYQRSPMLTLAGQRLRFWKAALSAATRKMKLSNKICEQGRLAGIMVECVSIITKRQLRKRVRSARADLWDVQKNATTRRIEWLEANAQDISRAANEIDWKKKMTTMAKLAKERGVNRKMTNAIKGFHQGLDRIEIPRYEWFYSHEAKELYHFDKGVFEAHAAMRPQAALQPTNPTRFHTHHHLKVLPNDAVIATVQVSDVHVLLKGVCESCNIWKEVTNTKEIEKLIKARNKRHLQQATLEEGRIHDPVVQRLLEDNGTNDLVDDLLEGKMDIDAVADEAIQAWLSAIQQTASEMKLPPMTGEISPDKFQQAFKAVDEHTSSSPSGIHYSLWKVLARDDDLAKWLSVMMSLPFMYGFVNKRWTKEIDVMLEKKKGVRKIHQLRIIGILEADFNTALKILFAKRLMTIAETNGSLSEEQWGSRANRTSTDAALLKMMTFEYGRYMKVTIALFANDQTACFDRMWPDMSNVVAQAFGAEKVPLQCRSRTIHALQRHIKTGHGVSKTSYGNTRGDAMIQGEVQGKGDVASLWAMTSSTLLRAHQQLAPGLDLPSVCGGEGGIKRNNAGYVDDVDTMTSSMDYGDQAAEESMCKLTVSAQKWSNIQDVVATSTAFHKCAAQILTYTPTNGSLKINYDYEYNIKLQDSVGAETEIKLLKANMPNVGLGFSQCPDGNMTHEFEARRGKIQHMCKAAASMHLTQKEAYTMLSCRLDPQTTYGMRLSQFTVKQCHQLDVMVMRTFLPLLVINRSSPRAMVHGPIQYGGMGIMKHSASQDKWGIHYLLQTLRWDKETAETVLTVINAFQQASGFVCKVLECPEIEIDYVDRGWIHHIRDRLRALKGRLAIEDAWSPKSQRVNDESIMELIAFNGELKKKERILANECRIWMGVTCISELATEGGTHIPFERLTGRWQASTFESRRLPNQPEPTKKHWSALRRCLRKTFCTTESPYKMGGSYKLDTPLHEWMPVERNVKYQCYINNSDIYWQDEYNCYKCEKTSTTNIYQIDYDNVEAPPLESHPIRARFIEDGRIWVWRSYKVRTIPSRHQQVTVIQNDLKEEEIFRHINVISDASVHIKRRRAAGAWSIIYRGESKKRRLAVTQLETHPHSHSYRHEIETLYHGLKDVTDQLPASHFVTQHMDCEGGLTKVNQFIYSPKQVMAPDMDLVLAYQELRKQSHHKVTTKWVMGHADKKKAEHPETITPMEHENIRCDGAANECVDELTTGTTFRPLPGYKALLQLNDEWITTHYRECIEFANTEPDMIEYAKKRLDLDDDTFNDVNWDAIGRLRTQHPIHRIVRTSKMIYRWMPVGHNWQKCNLETDRCPCCNQLDETFEHVLQCTHPDMSETRVNAYAMIRLELVEEDFPSNFINVFMNALSIVPLQSKKKQISAEILEQAWQAQSEIGFYHMNVGLLTRKWTEALEQFDVEQAESRMEFVLHLIWDHLCEPMWKQRNTIAHSKEAKRNCRDSETLKDQLRWYTRHRNEVLDYRHRYLAEFSHEDLQRWSHATLVAKITTLTNCKEFFDNKIKQKSKNQKTIHDWRDQYMRLRNGRYVGANIRQRRGRSHQGNTPTEDSEEVEFEWEPHYDTAL